MKKRERAEETKRGMSPSAFGILAAAGSIIGLHVWGYLDPSHHNWGTHLFAFYGPTIALASLAVAGLLLLPSLQARFTSAADQIIRSLAKVPVAILIAITITGLVAAAKLFPAQMHLLGDGAVLLRSNAQAVSGSGLEKSFSNQPLMLWIYQWALTLHSAGTAASPLEIYSFIDLVAGGIFVVLLFWFFRTLERPSFEKVCLASILFLSASTQFFFGYVENYVLQFVVVTLFLMSSWRAIERRQSIIIPIASYVLLIGLHLGFLILSPALGYVIFWRMKKNMLKALLVCSGLGILGLGVVISTGYDLGHLFHRFSSESVDFLQPFSATGGNFPYPIFSLWHLWDSLNGHLLVAPFALVVAAILLIVHRREIDWRNPVLIFLLIATACGLLFTWIVNFALGMARDWDLFSTFLVPLLMLNIYMFTLPLTMAPRRYVLTFVVAISLLHWIPWIGVNASAEKHLSRMELLNSPHLLSKVSQMVYDEALANLFFDGGNYPQARTYYERFLAIDNSNPRIIGNIADTYRKLGEKEKYFTMLQRAVALGSLDPGVYSNLGVEYASRGDTVKAIQFNERAVAIDSTHRLAHANLGILYASKNNLTAAERHFRTAIELGMTEPVLFQYAGDLEMMLARYDRALQYYDSYLQMVPGDKRIIEARDKVRQAFSGQKKQ